MTVKRGTFEFPFHRHDAEDINQSPHYRFVTDVQIARWNNNAGGNGTWNGDPSTINWTPSYRSVTDIQIQSWNGKANASHSHSATNVVESLTRTFITPTERINWNAAKASMDEFKLWTAQTLNSNSNNEVLIGNIQTHQYFIFRYIAKTAAGTETGQVEIESDASGVRIIGSTSLVSNTLVGFGDFSVKFDSINANFIKLVMPLSNSVLTVFKYNIEKIAL
jgi:hypothetical protein